MISGAIWRTYGSHCTTMFMNKQRWNHLRNFLYILCSKHYIQIAKAKCQSSNEIIYFVMEFVTKMTGTPQIMVKEIVTYNYVMKFTLHRTRFGGTCTKIGTIQRRLAWPLAQGWHANSWSVPYFSHRLFFLENPFNGFRPCNWSGLLFFEAFPLNKSKYVVPTVRNFGLDVLPFLAQ